MRAVGMPARGATRRTLGARRMRTLGRGTRTTPGGPLQRRATKGLAVAEVGPRLRQGTARGLL